MPGGPIPKTGALAANSGVTETKPGRAARQSLLRTKNRGADPNPGYTPLL